MNRYSGRITVNIRAETEEEAESLMVDAFPIPTQPEIELVEADVALEEEDVWLGVYKEWCRDPEQCRGMGHCPRDPNCAD